ncbi:MAG: DUF2894 domain-containing protein [Rubrivivax sp.]|nr:MAG: DUF2894 domain-containing protein [Rubrivivax sp.]
MTDTGAPTTALVASGDGGALLQALRERGAPGIDPVRFRLAESLLRRAADHEGAIRRMLEDKAAMLLEALKQTVVAQAEARPVATVAPGESKPGELAKLMAHIARHKPRMVDAPSTSSTASASASLKAKHDSPVDPGTLQFFRRTWSRLSSDQRLAQSRSSLPENAGPLNSQHLVHRSLNVMRELSPEYFDLFIAHVDALLWLERVNEQSAKDVGLPARAKGGKKAAGTRRG